MNTPTHAWSLNIVAGIMPALLTLMAAVALVLVASPVAADEPASATAALTLERAIATALSNHPQIDEADARKRQAAAVNRDAHARADWQVKLEARQVHLSEVPALSGFPAALRMPTIEFAKQDAAAAALTAQKVITSGHKIEAGIAQTRSAAQAASHATARVRQTVAFAAERDFLQLVLAQRERDVARQALETADEYLRVARSRHAARSAAEFDVLRAEVQTEEARQDLIRANALIDTARAALAQTLAVTNEPWTADEDGLPASATLPPLADAVREAVANRPELAGAECGIRAAAAAVTAHVHIQPRNNSDSAGGARTDGDTAAASSSTYALGEDAR